MKIVPTIPIAVALAVFSANFAQARSKKTDYKARTVLLTNAKGVHHTAFAANLNGSNVIVCLKKVFGTDIQISTFAGTPIDYSGILVPTEIQENSVVFIKIAEPAPPNLQSYEIERDIAANFKPGAKLAVHGCRQGKLRMAGGKGVAERIGERKILVKSKMTYDLSGAPVVAKSSGKVVGVAVCAPNSNRHQFKYAFRFDKTGKLGFIDKKSVKKEIQRSSKMYGAVKQYAKTSKKIKDWLKKNVPPRSSRSSKTIRALIKELKKLRKKLVETEKSLSNVSRNLKKSPEMKVPGIKERFRKNSLRADEILEGKHDTLMEKIEKTLKTLEKAAEKADRMAAKKSLR